MRGSRTPGDPGTVDGISSDFYTRAGTFNIDRDGALVNPAGLKVQGYAANGDGTFAASISDVQAPTAALPARATQSWNPWFRDARRRSLLKHRGESGRAIRVLRGRAHVCSST